MHVDCDDDFIIPRMLGEEETLDFNKATRVVGDVCVAIWSHYIQGD